MIPESDDGGTCTRTGTSDSMRFDSLETTYDCRYSESIETS